MAIWIQRICHFKISTLVGIPLLSSLFLGCSPPAAESTRNQTSATSHSQHVTAESKPTKRDLNYELWDAVYISGHHVGHMVTREESVSHDGKEALRTTQDSLIRVNRNNATTEQRIQTSILETAEGDIIEFDAVMKSGISEMQFHGVQQAANQLLIQQKTENGRASETLLTIPSACRGFFGTEQELRRRPLSIGESRTISVLAPIINAVVKVELHAVQYETTKLIDTQKQLLRIDVKNRMPSGQTIPSTMWVDEQNEIVKSTLGGLQTNFRTTKPQALKESEGSFDLGNDTMVFVSPPIKRPHQSNSITYLARLTNKNPAAVFSNASYQRVESQSESEATITVISTARASAHRSANTSPPTAADKTANNMIQSNHPSIRQMAQRIAPAETDRWKIAVACEKYVNQTVTDKNFSTALASAAEVAKSKAGDCTEHSVLLVALCRARNIPARAAIGLVYVVGQQAFGYHMWTEVWINDRWLPLDATLGEGGIGAAHLKVSDTNFSSSSGFESFLPVLDLMGKLQLSVVDQQ